MSTHLTCYNIRKRNNDKVIKLYFGVMSKALQLEDWNQIFAGEIVSTIDYSTLPGINSKIAHPFNDHRSVM